MSFVIYHRYSNCFISLIGNMKMELQGLTQIFYGTGKGMTTSALGTALRALDFGHKVHLVQFMKNGAESLPSELPGEINSLARFENFSYKRFGLGVWVTSSNKHEHQEEVDRTFEYLKEVLSKEYDIIIADEILYAVQLGLLDEEKVIELIKSKPAGKELILTGSHAAFPRIFELVDLVTEVRKVKHPYDKGIKARKGIEY